MVTVLEASQSSESFSLPLFGTVAVSQPHTNVVLGYTGSSGGNEQVSPIGLRKLFVLLYCHNRERKLTYEMVIIRITLQFSSEKSVQCLLCSRPWESPMICQKIIVGGTINLLFNSRSVLRCMQSRKLICLHSYFLYIPLPILCHYLYFYRFFLQRFLVVQTLCLYIYLKADFKGVQSLGLLEDTTSR